jgi:vitamin B12 transporter
LIHLPLFFGTGRRQKRSKSEDLPLLVIIDTFGRKVNHITMRRYPYLFVFAFTLFAMHRCYAQRNLTDSIIKLKEVEIKSNRLQHFTAGTKLETIDSIALANHSGQNLAALLSNESQVFIRNYGNTSLATSSMRGAGSNHTAVLWNGFNISGPMSGLLDFNLVPVSFLNSATLQYGGATALWGSGAIGGTVLLNNKGTFEKGTHLKVGLNYGSFEDKQQEFEFTSSKKKFISTTKFFNHDAKNNFPFINTAAFGKPEQILENAALKQYGLLQENYVQINAYQKINFRFWYQLNDRGLPSTMLSSVSQASQKDEFYRSTTEWQMTKNKVNLYVRAAYFDETLKFTDPQISLVSDFHSKSIIGEAESRFALTKNQSLNIGINNTYNQAFTKNYTKNALQNKTAIFASYSIQNNKANWKGTTSIRQEFINSGPIPFTASIGFEGRLLRPVRIRGTVSKNYRLPTYNDLYWAQGGNPNLLPENGINKELALALLKASDKFSLEAEACAFSNSIDNWILWTPNAIGIWSPKNILSVWSRGLEYDIKSSFLLGKLKIQLSAKYNYVLSTNEKTDAVNSASLQKQLIYFPLVKAQGSLGIIYADWNLFYTANYVGYRYTNSDNSNYLIPYQLGNLNLNKGFNLSNMKLRAHIQINNIWNESYQSIAYYAMPGRSYQFGISLNYNQPNSKN